MSTLTGGVGNDPLNGTNSSEQIEGLGGNDTIDALGGADTLIGGLDDDSLLGGSGSDIYIYNAGDGADTIVDSSGSADRLVLQGIAQGDLIVSRESAVEGDPGFDDLRLTFSGTAGSILLEDATQNTSSGSVDVIEFGTLGVPNNPTPTIAELVQIMVSNLDTAGDDTIIGTARTDTLSGGLGDDSLVGSFGNDTYVYSLGDGDDTISENSGTDKLVLQGVAQNDVQFSRASTDTTNPGFNDLLITFSGNAGSIVIVDGLINGGGGVIDTIEFGTLGVINNPTIGVTEVFQAAVDSQASAGDDTIIGTTRADTIEAGLGNDSLVGDQGNDVYIYSSGDGDDTIDEASGNGDTLVIQGIAQGDVIFSRASSVEADPGFNDVLITFNGQAGSILIDDALNNSSSVAVDRIEFGTFGVANNPFLTANEVAQAVVDGESTAGDDTVNGTARLDTLDGGPGNDLLLGGNGNDIYVYQPGDGDDTIDEISGTETLLIDGIAQGDVIFSRASTNSAAAAFDDLLITFTGQAGSITILDGLSSSTPQFIENYEFGPLGGLGNVTLTSTDVFTLAVNQQATAGDDTIFGTNLADTIEGGTGNDSIEGQIGNDTYIYSLGDGNDTINENSGIDTLVLQGIAQGDVILSRASTVQGDPGFDDVLITFSGQAGSILIDDGLVNSSSFTIDRLEFGTFGDANNPFLTSAEISQAVIDGEQTAGDDTINGTTRGETLEGGLGDDSLLGGSGGDLYIYTQGDGDDTIDDSSGSNVLEINGAQLTDINFVIVNIAGSPAASQQDLLINFDNQEGSILIEDIVSSTGTVSTSYGSFTIDDGTTVTNLTAAQVTALAVPSGPTFDPVANDDIFFTIEETPIIGGNVLTGGFSAPDFDQDNDPLTVLTVNGQAANVGSQITLASGALLTMQTNGSFDYDPNGAFEALDWGEFGTDTFGYRIADGTGGVDDATVTITVAGLTGGIPDVLPQPDTFTTLPDQAVSGNLFGDNGAGVDEGVGALTVTRINGVSIAQTGGVFELPSGATLTVASNGDFTYTPLLSNTGTIVNNFATDQFVYEVASGSDVETETVTINLDLSTSLLGTSGNDGNLRATINGDIVLGLEGNDNIRGARGNDLLNGGQGNDSLTGVSGDDIYFGGDGADAFFFDGRFLNNGDTIEVVDLDFGEGDTIRLIGFANNTFDDTVVPTNALFPLAGNSGVILNSLDDVEELVQAGQVTRVNNGGELQLDFTIDALAFTVELDGVAFA